MVILEFYNSINFHVAKFSVVLSIYIFISLPQLKFCNAVQYLNTLFQKYIGMLNTFLTVLTQKIILFQKAKVHWKDKDTFQMSKKGSICICMKNLTRLKNTVSIMFPPMICIKVMFMKHDSIFILTDFFHTSFVQNPVLTHIFIRHIAHIADSK